MQRIAKEALKRAGYRAWLFPVLAAEWILFKCCYPYADYFTDSYSYIGAAAAHDAIGYRPIGYSIFLRAVHWIWASDTFLVTLQYVLVQTASLGLILWLRRWCSLSERTLRVLFAFLILNPLIPYTCNYVSSDALFIALSLVWLIVLLELLRRPSWRWLIVQIILLFVIFHLRYLAMYYPAVSALTVLLAKKAKPVLKLAGVAGSIGVIAFSISLVRQTTFRETGAPVFSAFSGWQIASNAMNMYPYIHTDTTGLPSPECLRLEEDVRAYFDKMGPSLRDRGPSATTEYMWVGNSPLHVYLAEYRRHTATDYFTAWNRVAPVFTQYGYFLIRRHPWAYVRYYMWPSAVGFFWSPLDVFAVYNEGHETVDPVARDWFHYKTLRPQVLSATVQGRLLAPMPAVYLALNIVFIVIVVVFLSSRVRRDLHPLFSGCLRLGSAYLLANASFCIVASPSVFRYQVLPVIILFVLSTCGFYCLTFQYGQIGKPSPASDRRD
ncbi:MAG TPA: hypothetical protein VGQ51_07530 [Puia sp.]|jgi:hypothetical protein|nr:hypothetical protein [Puia sp.]